MLNPEFKLLQQICEESSSNKKQALLKQGATENLKRFLFYSYSRFLTYRVKQIELPDKFNQVQPELWAEFFQLCDLLASHSMGTSDAKGAIRAFLSKSTESSAAWFYKALLRDLDIGMDEKSINKVFPGLLPTFEVQLAAKLEDHWDNLKYPVLAEKKEDGIRSIAICDGSGVKFYSRDGHEQPSLQPLARQVMALRPGTRFVLDGEAISIKFNPNNKVAVKNKDNNWRFEMAKSMVRSSKTTPEECLEYLGYSVWDFLEYDTFVSQLKSPPLKERKIQLCALFERTSGSTRPNIQLMQNVLCHNAAEVQAVFDQMVADKEEGIIVKDLNRSYEFKRSSAVLKLKKWDTIDMWITDVQEGNGKFQGMVGALICENDELKSKVGSGPLLTDDTRLDLFVEHLAGRLKGQWIEVRIQEQTADNSCRIGTAVRMREDRERKML